ncbi:3'-5' exonuclease [Flavicella marina]|uniref:3'-5' exonuclease n=1 Tax=Flavicella marina TaxID=1475951 RepID=UPI001264F506|nr:3'-5' exonuclease [Flavicella marina]
MTSYENEILVLDIETTGLSSRNDYILELGIVKLNIDTGEITELFDKVFKDPNLTAKHRNSWIFQNGFMDIEEVRNANPISDYKDEIQQTLNAFKGKITAWNCDFDFSFLEANGFELGQKTTCPMKASTDFFKIESSRGYKWPKAQEAWDILFPTTPKIEAHRGLDDSIMEAKIIFELIQKGIYHL